MQVPSPTSAGADKHVRLAGKVVAGGVLGKERSCRDGASADAHADPERIPRLAVGGRKLSCFCHVDPAAAGPDEHIHRPRRACRSVEVRGVSRPNHNGVAADGHRGAEPLTVVRRGELGHLSHVGPSIGGFYIHVHRAKCLNVGIECPHYHGIAADRDRESKPVLRRPLRGSEFSQLHQACWWRSMQRQRGEPGGEQGKQQESQLRHRGPPQAAILARHLTTIPAGCQLNLRGKMP